MTSESLEALLVRRGIELTALFSPLHAIVVDELHAFIGNERGVQLQSLLHRLELSIGRRVIRVGLSATLGNVRAASEFLRPRHGHEVIVLENLEPRQAVLLQLRGYQTGESLCAEGVTGPGEIGNTESPCNAAIAQHLLQHMRGDNNLVFTKSRGDVELYADLLRRQSEVMGIPNEFFPHHANLSRTEREALENRLRDPVLPTTALCTSTLELGIDIGEVVSVGQIGTPFSVASLRQRLGRSGRRPGKPATMRLYIKEGAWRRGLHPIDMLRCELVQAIAMVKLLITDWRESPRSGGLHLSTLVQQILAIITQNGGVTADYAYTALCADGPFVTVSRSIFVEVLEAIGSPDAQLIEQLADGTLVLAARGERLVERHDFYAVFPTPAEYRVVCNGRELGSLPMATILVPGMSIIFSGRRWQVVEISYERTTILVAPSCAGVPPPFGGDGGDIGDAVVMEMRRVYEGIDVPSFLDKGARELLEQARQGYRELGLDRTLVVESDGDTFLFPWTGTVVANTFSLALKAMGLTASLRRVTIEVQHTQSGGVRSCLRELSDGPRPEPARLVARSMNLRQQKYDRFLSWELVAAGLASDRLDLESIPSVARYLLANSHSA